MWVHNDWAASFTIFGGIYAQTIDFLLVTFDIFFLHLVLCKMLKLKVRVVTFILFKPCGTLHQRLHVSIFIYFVWVYVLPTLMKYTLNIEATLFGLKTLCFIICQSNTARLLVLLEICGRMRSPKFLPLLLTHSHDEITIIILTRFYE